MCIRDRTAPGDAAATAAEKPGEGVWVNYDFVPGDRILFFDDFSRSPVGDFPSRLEFGEGNMEVAEWKGQRYLRSTTYSEVTIPLPEALPERYTIEFDYVGPSSDNTAEIHFEPEDEPGLDYVTFFWNLRCGVRNSHVPRAEVDIPEGYKERPAQCRVMADGKYLKVYVNDTRVANVPNASYPRQNGLRLHLWAHPQSPLLIGNIRVAEGGKRVLYDALQATGRVATQGIYFDSGSDRLRPESTPTLTEIATMLRDHADLRLRIEGHTDDVGEDAANLDLSKKRAAAVRTYLIDSQKIDGARLETDGFGESKPVATNETSEGRQSNRRVELVRL
ncbi:MAG: OmpA family protein [Candidatus Eisenbacteria bacterium]|nr:OmpA family protein [Candidatus Eisenbacteria bacterium]